MKVKLSRDFTCSPRGNRVTFTKGTYNVPEQMPAQIARRAIAAGIGHEVLTRSKKEKAPENKALGEAEENK